MATSRSKGPNLLPLTIPFFLSCLFIPALLWGGYKAAEAREEESQRHEERFKQHSFRECYPYQLKSYDYREYSYVCSGESEGGGDGRLH